MNHKSSCTELKIRQLYVFSAVNLAVCLEFIFKIFLHLEFRAGITNQHLCGID